MSYNITSICVNNWWQALLTLSDGKIWFTNDITNKNMVWGEIKGPPGGLIQISASARLSRFLGVSKDNQTYYTDDNIYNNNKPLWKLSTPGVKYISVADKFHAYGIGLDDLLYFCNDVSLKSPWVSVPCLVMGNISIPGPPGTAPYSVPGLVNTKIKTVSSIAIGTWGYIAVETLDGKIYWATVWGIDKPSWILVGDGTCPLLKSDGTLTYLNPNGQIKRYSGNITIGQTKGNYKVITVSSEKFKLIATNDKSELIINVSKTNIPGYNGITKDSPITLINNGLPNPGYYGNKYYGNTVPVTKAPYELKLSGAIPVTNFRNTIEYKYKSCGWSSHCNQFYRSDWPYSEEGLAIESPINVETNWVEYSGEGNCKAGNDALIVTAATAAALNPAGVTAAALIAKNGKKIESWCVMPVSGLTHVFGQGTDKISILPNNKQYPIDSKSPSALDLQITPFNKVMTPFVAKYTDPHFFDNFKATFSSLSFNIPDPTDPVDIDAGIPLILIGYYSKQMLTLEILNDYMTKYAFTPIMENGKTIPRYEKTIGVGILPSTPIDIWKNTIVNVEFFKKAANAYCSDKTLLTGWCKTYCNTAGNDCDTNLTTFCRSGGTGKLPTGYIPGKFLTTPITQGLLDAAYPKYSAVDSKNMCGCFMPNDYYNLLDIKAFQDTKADKDMYETLFKQGGIGGRPMCDPFTSCSMGGDVIPNRNDVSMGTCPSKNIQNCIQNNTISADNGQGNTIVNQQAMNCIQNVQNIAVADKAAADKAIADKANVVTPSSETPSSGTPSSETPSSGTPSSGTPSSETPSSETPPSEIPSSETPPSEIPSSETPPSGMSSVTIAIIIAIIVIIIGGGAFMALKK